MAGLLMTAAAGLLLSCGGDGVAGPGLAEGAQDDGPVKLNYECGNTFRIRNSTYDSVTVIWEAEGTAERDTVVLPPRPAGEGFSATLITTAAAATVRLLDLDGKLIVSKQNEGGPACGGVGVGLQPPDSIPAWVYADSNFTSGSSLITGQFVKSVLIVRFKSGTSIADRQAAVASVGGEVIGGRPLDGGEGWYFVKIQDDGSGASLLDAAAQLNALPQVGAATLEIVVDALYRNPVDGNGWKDWQLVPTAADGNNWALEVLRMPHAWGCEIGSSSAVIALVDRGFQGLTEISSRFDPSFVPVYEAFDPVRVNDHGTSVMAALAAAGDNGAGVTGVLWNSAVRVYQVAVPPSRSSTLSDVIKQMARAARDGARVVNVSQGLNWNGVYTGSTADFIRIEQLRLQLQNELDELRRNALASPLYVISAGNDGLDAATSAFPAVASGPDSASILVVGAIDIGLRRWQSPTQSSNGGPLVNLAAPGEDVFSLRGSGQIEPVSGTSIAAPFVTGIAGLLASFDPRLTARQLRALILEGARRGGLTASGFQQAVPIPDAYESLRAAAERPGAPLCGNRLYPENQSLTVSRGLGSEILATFPAEIAFLQPYHGGRRVDLFVDGVGSSAVVLGPAGWTTTDPAGLPPDSVGGTWRSLSGLTHAGDSVLRVLNTAGDNTFEVSLGTSSAIGRQLASVNIQLAPPSRDAIRRRANYDSTGAFTGSYSYPDSSAASNYEAISRVASAYSPMGDRALVSFSRLLHSFQGATGWEPCLDAEMRDGVWDCEFRLMQYQVLPIEAEVYSIPAGGGNATVAWEIPGRSINWLGISEDGEQLVLATSVEQAGIGQDVSANACQIEYRDRTNPSQAQLAVPNSIACIARGTGGLAPLRGRHATGPQVPLPTGG